MGYKHRLPARKSISLSLSQEYISLKAFNGKNISQRKTLKAKKFKAEQHIDVKALCETYPKNISYLVCYRTREGKMVGGQNDGQGGFGNDLTNVITPDSQEELARRSARTVKLMGKGVVKVVHRCDDAKENKNLDIRPFDVGICVRPN